MGEPMDEMTRNIRPLGDFAQGRYLTYPHANGFADGGRNLVLGQYGGETFSLWHYNLKTGREAKIGEWPRSSCGTEMLWFDVATLANVLVTIVDNAVWKIDLNDTSPEPQVIYRETTGTLQALPSTTADGAKVLVGRKEGEWYQVLEIDAIAASLPRILFQSHWFANHFHFCPHDEAWIGFSHEGPTDQIADRAWGWHPHAASKGKCLFDNALAGLFVGHERWSFHAVSLVAVAYGASPQGPRGIYEISPQSSSPRLVSEGDRDWHVNVSQDGRWAVVDTTGPHDAPGRGWDGAGLVSDIQVLDMQSGRREFIARSRFAKDFHLHPHPVFSPDGATIYFNEASEDGRTCRVMAADNPLFGESKSEGDLRLMQK